MKKQELIDRLTKTDGETVALEQLVEAYGGKTEVAKALGLDASDPKKDPEPSPASPDPSKDLSADVRKSLPAPVAAYLEQLEKKNDETATLLKGILAKSEAEEKAALHARVEKLKKAGLPVDEKTTAEQVDVLEKAQEQWQGALEQVGLFKAHGSVSKSNPNTRSVRELVQQEITRELGREPLSKAEAATVKNRLYQMNPGLLTAVLKEERAERLARRIG